MRRTSSGDQTVTQSFPEDILKNQSTIFQKLEDIGIFVPHEQPHSPFYCCYDFESILSQDDSSKNGESFPFTSKHITLSVGIAFNIPNFEDPISFVSEGSEAVLVQKMVDYCRVGQVGHRKDINMNFVKGDTVGRYSMFYFRSHYTYQQYA